jgi:putative endonuclease
MIGTTHRDRDLRRVREAAGRVAEWLAAAALILRGYRILAWRAVTPYGEIDLVAVRGRRLAFVEVKQRATHAAARASLSNAQTGRLHDAADSWIKRRRRYRAHRRGFDAVLVAPWSWPRVLTDALQPAIGRGIR